jgi:hypothetical protein
MSGADIVAELALATGMLVVIVALHGLLLTFASRRLSARFTLMSWSTPHWQIGALMSLTVAALVAFHLVEALVWTLPLYGLSIENFRDAFSYVLEAYTTLGESIVVLPPKYRLVGPVIAISGLFTFGWPAVRWSMSWARSSGSSQAHAPDRGRKGGTGGAQWAVRAVTAGVTARSRRRSRPGRTSAGTPRVARRRSRYGSAW